MHLIPKVMDDMPYVPVCVFQIHTQMQFHELVKGLSMWRGKMVVKVKVYGIVIRSMEFSDRVEYTLDDGTGLIYAVHWKREKSVIYSHGDAVVVFGRLKAGNGGCDRRRNIVANVVQVSRSISDEVQHWMEIRNAMEHTKVDVMVSEEMKEEAKRVKEKTMIQNGIIHGSMFELDRNSEDFNSIEIKLFAMLVDWQAEQDSVVQFLFHEAIDRAAQKWNMRSKVKSGLKALRKLGAIVLQDAHADMYVIVSYKYYIKPALLDVIRANYYDKSFSLEQLQICCSFCVALKPISVKLLNMSLHRLQSEQTITYMPHEQRYKLC